MSSEPFSETFYGTAFKFFCGGKISIKLAGIGYERFSRNSPWQVALETSLATESGSGSLMRSWHHVCIPFGGDGWVGPGGGTVGSALWGRARMQLNKQYELFRHFSVISLLHFPCFQRNFLLEVNSPSCLTLIWPMAQALSPRLFYIWRLYWSLLGEFWKAGRKGHLLVILFLSTLYDK